MKNREKYRTLQKSKSLIPKKKLSRLSRVLDIKEEIQEQSTNIDLEEERKKKYFSYNLPASKLLNTSIEVNENYSESELHEKSNELIYALGTFGVNGKVRRINQGPVITLFEVEPDEGVRVSKSKYSPSIFSIWFPFE